MSIVNDSNAKRRVEKIRLSVEFTPHIALGVIVVGVVISTFVCWYAIPRFTMLSVEVDAAYQSTLQAGLTVGTVFGAGIMLGISSISYGVWLLFHRQADLLLLDVWDEYLRSQWDEETSD